MKILRQVLVLSLICISLSACFKKSYDNPPDVSQYDPKIPCNLTVQQLSDLALRMPSTATANSFRIMGDSTIYGVVTADDRSGNFYKQIVIQDSTGGINIGISQYDIYDDYPIGRKVYIHLKGLTLINYEGYPEIEYLATLVNGKITLNGIPASLETSYITGANYPNVVVPDTITMAQLLSNPNQYLSRLVTIQNMEFASTAVNVPYAPSPSSGISSVSLPIHDCNNATISSTGSMVMYNSAYADFQSSLTPSGQGNLTGIVSIYNGGTIQFLIRDTTDVQFSGPRICP